MVQPLNSVTRKTVDFEWSVKCQNSLNSLKKSLVSPPILKYPDLSKQFILTVDASKSACGGILSQIYEGHDLPVAYASNKAELNKSTIEKELIAIYFAIKKFRPYIYGTKFLVKSDHKPLKYLFNMKDPSLRLTRMRLELEEYDFEVEYIQGKCNVGTDALSRINIQDVKNISEGNIAIVTRSMTRNKNVEYNNNENVSEVKKVQVYDNTNENTKKIPLIKFVCTKARTNDSNIMKIDFVIYKNGRKIKVLENNFKIPFINENDIFNVFFSRLEKIVNELGINKICINANDDIFKNIRYEEFKIQGNDLLDKLQVVIMRPIIRINDLDEQKRLIEIMILSLKGIVDRKDYMRN